MPDFITLIMLATCTGSSLCFWSLGRSIYNASTPTTANGIDARVRCRAEKLPSMIATGAHAACEHAPLCAFPSYAHSFLRESIPTHEQKLVSASRATTIFIVSDGDKVNITLRMDKSGSCAPVVVAKYFGSRNAEIGIVRCETVLPSVGSQRDDRSIGRIDNPSLAWRIYRSVPLLSTVPEALNIELRHTLGFQSSPA